MCCYSSYHHEYLDTIPMREVQETEENALFWRCSARRASKL